MSVNRSGPGPAGPLPRRFIVAMLGLAGVVLLAACGSKGISGPATDNLGRGSSGELICPRVAQAGASGSPVVTSVSPRAGSEKGGDSVTIIGSGFSASAEVIFGATKARAVNVHSGTRIVAISPAQPSHVQVCITVITPKGRSAAEAGDFFSYRGVMATPSVGPSP